MAIKKLIKNGIRSTLLAAFLFSLPINAGNNVELNKAQRNYTFAPSQKTDKEKKLKGMARIDTSYASKEFSGTQLYFSNSDQVDIEQVKSTLEKFPEKIRKEVKKVFLCEERDYSSIWGKGYSDYTSATTDMNDGVIYVNYSKNDKQLEEIVSHESIHSFESYREKPQYREFSELKQKAEGIEIWADSMRFKDMRDQELEKAKKIYKQIDSLKTIPNSYKIEKEWSLLLSNYIIPPTTRTSSGKVLWKNVSDEKNKDAPMAGFVTPYSTYIAEDRPETVKYAMINPGIINSIIYGKDAKAAELMSKKLLLLKKYEYISDETYQNCIKNKVDTEKK